MGCHDATAWFSGRVTEWLDVADKACERIRVKHERKGCAPGRLNPRQRRRADTGGRADDDRAKTALTQEFGECVRR
jgi:hypothetical protein